MEASQLTKAIIAIKREFQDSVKNKVQDEFQQNAFQFVLNTLERMEAECRTYNLKPRSERHGVIARIVVESDPSVISPDLGGRLIDVEKAYQECH